MFEIRDSLKKLIERLKMNRVRIIATFGGIGVAVGFGILIASNSPSDLVKLFASLFTIFGLGMLVISFKLAIDADNHSRNETQEIIGLLKDIKTNTKNKGGEK